jgi:hypothetical protein
MSCGILARSSPLDRCWIAARLSYQSRYARSEVGLEGRGGYDSHSDFQIEPHINDVTLMILPKATHNHVFKLLQVVMIHVASLCGTKRHRSFLLTCQIFTFVDDISAVVEDLQ